MVEEYCPAFWLHRDELYNPIAVPEYLKHCELWFEDRKVLETGDVTEERLITQSAPVGSTKTCPHGDGSYVTVLFSCTRRAAITGRKWQHNTKWTGP